MPSPSASAVHEPPQTPKASNWLPSQSQSPAGMPSPLQTPHSSATADPPHSPAQSTATRQLPSQSTFADAGYVQEPSSSSASALKLQAPSNRCNRSGGGTTASKRTRTVERHGCLNLVSTNTKWEHLIVHLTRNRTSRRYLRAINQRPLVGSALAAVFNTYHEPPVRVLTFNSVPPVWKYPEMVGDNEVSSTKEGSAAPAKPTSPQDLQVQWWRSCHPPGPGRTRERRG